MEHSGDFYRRNLPHWQPEDAIIFVTYRLADSLPADVTAQLREQRQRMAEEPLRPGENEHEKTLRLGRRFFASMDGAVHKFAAEATERNHLSDPRIAQLVRDGLYYWDGRRFRLHRYVIMPNHVHILIEPLRVTGADSKGRGSPSDEAGDYPLSTIMQGIKGYSARKANEILARRGPFWQSESFDHWIRSEKEYKGAIQYIDMNPVKAGLCSALRDWKWSSAADAA